MNPLQLYNFVPTTVNGNQFLSFRQPGAYMTNFQNSSDLYAYFVNNASSKGGVTTGHQLRQYLQDNGELISSSLFNNTAKQFINMDPQGSPNTCSGSYPSVILSGGRPLVNNDGTVQSFAPQCNDPGQSCFMVWNDTPLPQQGPHCQVNPNNGQSPYTLLR
jgi:hypothetical protein